MRGRKEQTYFITMVIKNSDSRPNGHCSCLCPLRHYQPSMQIVILGYVSMAVQAISITSFDDLKKYSEEVPSLVLSSI